jgi:hypothetical protein
MMIRGHTAASSDVYTAGRLAQIVLTDVSIAGIAAADRQRRRHLLLIRELVIEVLDVFQRLLIVLLRILRRRHLLPACVISAVLFIGAGFILREAVEVERRDDRRALLGDVRPSAQKAVRVVRAERVVVL